MLFKSDVNLEKKLIEKDDFFNNCGNYKKSLGKQSFFFFTLKVSKSLKEFSEISLSKVTIRLMEKNYLWLERRGVYCDLPLHTFPNFCSINLVWRYEENSVYTSAIER